MGFKRIRILILASLMLVVLATLRLEAQPSKSALKEHLQRQMPECVSIMSFELKASDNLGNKIEPIWKFRFVAKGILKEELYIETGNFMNTRIMSLVPIARESKDIYGTATATLVKEQWNITFVYEDNKFLADQTYSAATPKSKLSGSYVIAGTENEKILIDRTVNALLQGEAGGDSLKMAEDLFYGRKDARVKDILFRLLSAELDNLLDDHFRNLNFNKKERMHSIIGKLGELGDMRAVPSLLRAVATYNVELYHRYYLSSAAINALERMGLRVLPEIEEEYNPLMEWVYSPVYHRYTTKFSAWGMDKNIKIWLENLAKRLGGSISLVLDVEQLEKPGRIVEEKFTFEVGGQKGNKKNIDFVVTRPGTITIEASWEAPPATGNTRAAREQLAFILQGPGEPVRTKYPTRSPMTLTADVSREITSRGTKWKLGIIRNKATEAKVTLLIKHPE